MLANCQNIIAQVHSDVKKEVQSGNVATYIPALAGVDPDKFGICLKTLEGEVFEDGDSEERFSIQSIAKVLALALAYGRMGASIWERVGVEPSGTAFNSLVQLEVEKGVPRNPLINAGALVICDILYSHLEKPREELLAFIRKLSSNPEITYDEEISQSERDTGFKNYALANLMKSYGRIDNDIEDVLDLYFHMCSVKMSCSEVAQSFLFLANDGKMPQTNEAIVSPIQSKRMNAIMQTCGFYDEAGEFAFRVGLPGKSGVGGGIVAILPDSYALAVWSPRLNEKGNSCRGMSFLEQFTSMTDASIF